MWTASADTLAPGKPVTLSWNNGAGLTFELGLSVDDNYMFGVDADGEEHPGAPVKLFPWSRMRRDYTPKSRRLITVLFEGC